MSMQTIVKHSDSFESDVLLSRTVISQLMFVSFILWLIYVSTVNRNLFHNSVEVFSSFIAIATLMLAVNVYTISEKDLFLFLGMGFFFVGVLNLLHTYSADNTHYFLIERNATSLKFNFASKVVESLTFLLTALYCGTNGKNTNKTKQHILFTFYFVLFAGSLFLCNERISFQVLDLINKRVLIWAAVNHMMIIPNILAAIVFFRNRSNMSKCIFLDLMAMIFLVCLSDILFSVHFLNHSIIYILGHLIKVAAYITMYNAIVLHGLRKPYDTLKYHYDDALRININQKNDMKTIQEAFTHNEQCWDLVVNSSSDGMVIHRDGQVLLANKRAAEILGAKDIDALIGSNIICSVHEDFVQLVNAKISQAFISNKTVQPFEFLAMRENGEVIDVEATMGSFIYQGANCTISIFRDISQRKHYEVLKDDVREMEFELIHSNELNRFQNELFSNISHELKTPLNVLLSAIQLLTASGKCDAADCVLAKRNPLLNTMKQNCYRLLRIVNNIIDISRADMGHLRMKRKNCNIVSVIEDVTLSVVDYINIRSIELVFDTDTEEKIMAIDIDMIERVMLNLLSNAIKFTEKNGEIFVKLEDKGDYVIISVADNGVGIPEDKLEMIFDRFGQVDKTLARNREGSGIGLSLVKSIVEMHNGTIKAQSVVGVGSEFIITLPVETIIAETVERELHTHDSNEKVIIEFSDIY